MRAALDASQDAVCFVDVATGRITHANPVAEGLFGYSGNDWTTITLTDLVQEGENVDCDVGHVCALPRSPQGWSLYCSCVESVRSSSGCTAVAIFRPRMEVEPISDSDRDPLTGLPNRRVFERRLLKSLEQKHTNFAVLFLDLDDFKQVNDRFGHTLATACSAELPSACPRVATG